MVLVDTSVWVDHLRRDSARLRELLYADRVLTHPFVVGEIACGALQNRSRVLRYLGSLPEARLAGHDEVLRLIEDRSLYGQGIGWVDAHLLASALLSGCSLWTLDKRLILVASSLGIAA